MNYRVIRPSLALARHVHHYWVFEDAGTSHSEIILPDGCVELMFQLDGCLLGTVAAEVSPAYPISSLLGQLRRGISVRTTGRVSLFGVRIRPAAARDLFRFPQRELADRVLAIEDLWGFAGRSLEQQVLESADDRKRVSAVERALLGRIRGQGPAEAVGLALRAIVASGGTMRLDRLASQTASSCRQLERQFQEQIGLTAKTFSRIVRFQRTLQVIERDKAAWASLAAECGYYDQSHLIREFRDFTERTPSDYLRHAAEVSRLSGGSGPGFVGFLQDFSGGADYFGFTTHRRVVWQA